jgi:galactokinase
MRRFHAPGRVNLIGEHTDYSGGLALPCAIERGVTLALDGPADSIRLRSDSEAEPVALPAGGGGEARGWGRFVAAVAAELDEAGRPPIGMEGKLTSDLPAGAGLSSSAALEVAVALGLCAVADFQPAPEELVRLCVRAEIRAVGVPSGPLDQAASVLGRAEELVLLDCGTLAHEPVPFPEELELVIVDSATPRELESSGYADRRAELERALDAEEGEDLDPVAERRLRHVRAENERVRRAAELLRAPDGLDRAALASLLAEGHASLRDLYEVSTPELDMLVELAGAEGAVGARMTGGGFGGAIVALAERGAGEDLGERVARRYRERRPELEPTVIVGRPAAGAREL